MEYGTDRIPHDKREYGFIDEVTTWFGSGVNTGSWFFGGMAAALGLAFVWQYALIFLPLMMIPWAMIGWIAWKHGSSTVATSRPALGVKGSRWAGVGEFFGMIGWPSVNTFIAAISLTYVFKHMWGWAAYGEPGSLWPMILGITITAFLQGLIVVVGQRAIKYLEWVAVALLIVLGIWETIVVLQQWDYSRLMAVTMPEAQHSWQFYIDLAFGFCWGWAMIGDFGRLAKGPVSATFGSWLGINLGQGWFMLVGALGVIGVVMTTGVYNPGASDPSSTIAALGLGLVAFLVVFFATVSTNVTVLYGSGMGLIGASQTKSPKKYLFFVAILQFIMCFLPLTFSSFLHYFETFLGIIGGIFIPLWTLIVTDYFIVRRLQVEDEDLFAGTNSDGSTKSRLGDWNAAGWISGAIGLGLFYLLHYLLTDIAAVTTASIPTIVVTFASYLLLTLVVGVGKQTRVVQPG